MAGGGQRLTDGGLLCATATGPGTLSSGAGAWAGVPDLHHPAGPLPGSGTGAWANAVAVAFHPVVAGRLAAAADSSPTAAAAASFDTTAWRRLETVAFQ
jgi:hypothetical protein